MSWIVSRKHRFIFIHIPKTGGTSIAEPGDGSRGSGALLKCLGEHDYVQPGHIRAVGLKSRLQDDWDSYFKFAFVRNPWDRLVSLYHYFLQDQDKTGTALGRRIAECRDFPDFCSKMDELELDPHFDQQVSYLVDYEGSLLVDCIGRFETLESDFSSICRRLGLPGIRLPHHRRSRHDEYRAYYDKSSRELVGFRYANDVEALKYIF
jgi:hypothetical protein